MPIKTDKERARITLSRDVKALLLQEQKRRSMLRPNRKQIEIGTIIDELVRHHLGQGQKDFLINELDRLANERDKIEAEQAGIREKIRKIKEAEEQQEQKQPDPYMSALRKSIIIDNQ